MIDAYAARILGAAIESLRTDILPKLGDDETRIRFDQITRLLNSVLARLSLREEGLKQLLASAATVVSVPPIELVDPSLPDLERQRQKVEQAISDSIPALLDEVGGSNEGVQKLEKIVNLEKAFFISQDADVSKGSQVVFRGGRIDEEIPAAAVSEHPPINDITLTAYLCQRLQRRDVKALNIRAIPGGFSKLTLFFTLLDESDGSKKDLVIRKDMPAPFLDKTVVSEFDLLQHLYERDFPVAKPLWLEMDYSVFRGRFIVSERVGGTSDSSSWASDPMRATKACKELAQVLATLHAFSPQDLGYSEDLRAASTGELMEREIDQWIELFHAKKAEPLPLQELPLMWLRRNIPKELYGRRARIVHGDVGFHNLMFDDNGHVTALLDWEFSVLGDPTQDICFVRQFVDGIMDWQEFVDLYQSLGGIPPCQEAEFFFSLWSMTRNCVGCVDARALFDTVMPKEVKFALAGHVFAPYLYIDQCELLLSHLKEAQTTPADNRRIANDPQ